jgi:hypothetical protein
MSVTVITMLDVVPPWYARIEGVKVSINSLPTSILGSSTYNASMHHTNPAPGTTLSDNDVRTCVRVR